MTRSVLFCAHITSRNFQIRRTWLSTESGLNDMLLKTSNLLLDVKDLQSSFGWFPCVSNHQAMGEVDFFVFCPRFSKSGYIYLLLTGIFLWIVFHAILKNIHCVYRTPINYLLLNLAAADMILAIFFVPPYILIHTFTHPHGVPGTVLCRLLTGGVLAWIGAAASVFTLVVIATERYFAVLHPLESKGKLTYRKLKVRLTSYTKDKIFWRHGGIRFPRPVGVVCVQNEDIVNRPFVLTE